MRYVAPFGLRLWVMSPAAATKKKDEFDPNIFLATIGEGRKMVAVPKKQTIFAQGDEADAVFGTREADGDSGVSGRVFAAFAAHIGDSTLRQFQCGTMWTIGLSVHHD